MHQPSSPLSRLNDPAIPAEVAAAGLPISTFAASLSGQPSSVAGDGPVEKLASLSDCARRLNRTQQADRFLLLAWIAFDAPE
jgi:hypothetical protein